MSDAVDIRPLATYEELLQGVGLQKATWGRDFDDIVSAAMMRVAQKVGGVAAGAFDRSGRLRGLVFGITGVRDGGPVHWSHMLAVEPDWRGTGLGTALKAYQRRRVMWLGVGRMYWTFDPLESRNARFNLNRLGVRIDAYVQDMYGAGDTSPLHRGIGTDRLVAVWPLDDPRLSRRLERFENAMTWKDEDREAIFDPSAAGPIDYLSPREDLLRNALIDETATAEDTRSAPDDDSAEGLPRPRGDDSTEGLPRPRGNESAEARFVEIPSDIQRLKSAKPEAAIRWRNRTCATFLKYFSEGLDVAGFIRDPESGRCFYVLEEAVRDARE